MAANLQTGLRRSIKNSLETGLVGGDIFGASTLDLRFAQQKNLGPRVTFTRASSARYIGSDGFIQTAATNEARFDHAPQVEEYLLTEDDFILLYEDSTFITVDSLDSCVSLGLLVEEARTNLFTWSEDLSNAIWGVNNTTVSANAVSAPDGTVTADKVIETTATSTHDIRRFPSFTSGLSYSNSIYAKVDGRSLLSITLPAAAFGSAAAARFDLDAVTATITTAGTNTTASITPAGNGWYRCLIKSDATATASGSVFWNLQATTGTTSYTGNGVSGLYLWGAQLEAGAFSTSYIPTTTASATRAADVASITGSNFSSWYNQTEGTVFVDVNSAPVNTIAQFAYNIRDASNASRMGCRRNTNGGIAILVTDNNTTQGDVGSGTVIAGSSNYKNSFAYKLNDLAASTNGGNIVVDTTATIPVTTELSIGTGFGSGSCNGTIKRLTYWPTRLANTTLQQITQP